jgi:hypothetical protein
MARIRCHYPDCVFLDDGFCSATAVDIDPDLGCTTYRAIGDVIEDDEDLFEEELLDDWDIEELMSVDDPLDDDDELLDS